MKKMQAGSYPEYRRYLAVRVSLAVVVAGLAGTAAACENRSGEPVDELRIVELFHVDGVAGPGVPPFGRIADIEIGEDGSVYVLDALNRTVRVFDLAGAELRSFGQQGAGPGELERPIGLTWGPSGNLWVADSRLDRFTVFEPNGTLRATHRIVGPGLADPAAVAFSESGQLQAVAVDLPGGSLEEAKIVLVQYDLADGEVRPRALLDLPFAQPPEPYEYRGRGAVLILHVPFSGEPVFSLDDSGRLWYAQTREPFVHRWSPSSGVDRTVGRELEPVPVTSAERQEALDDMISTEDRTLVGQEGLTELRSLIPDRKPYLRGFFLDDAGGVWVFRTPPLGLDAAGYDVDIYDSTGTLVSVARVPLAPEPKPRIRSDLLAGVVRDELGIEAVGLYRIQR